VRTRTHQARFEGGVQLGQPAAVAAAALAGDSLARSVLLLDRRVQLRHARRVPLLRRGVQRQLRVQRAALRLGQRLHARRALGLAGVGRRAAIAARGRALRAGHGSCTPRAAASELLRAAWERAARRTLLEHKK
jgi:hypothetical protein